ncbi:patatin-like phospholipase family protein [Nanoarchaeota archaeon]
MRKALVLSGGGSRGAFQVGVLKGLKFKPDVIIGTSIGSLNGAYLAAGHSAEDLEHVWQYVTHRTFFPLKRLIKSPSLFRTYGLKKLIASRLPGTFEDLQIPFYVNSTRVDDGKSVYFNKGKLLPPVIASCARTPFFPPQTIGGVNYIDGGFSEYIGVRKSLELGCKKIVVLDTSRGYKYHVPRGVKIVRYAPKEIIPSYDFSKTKDLIEEGLNLIRHKGCRI